MPIAYAGNDMASGANDAACVPSQEHWREFQSMAEEVFRSELQRLSGQVQNNVREELNKFFKNRKALRAQKQMLATNMMHDLSDEDEDDHEWMARPWYSHFFTGPARQIAPEDLTLVGTPKAPTKELFHRPRLPGKSRKVGNRHSKSSPTSNKSSSSCSSMKPRLLTDTNSQENLRSQTEPCCDSAEPVDISTLSAPALIFRPPLATYKDEPQPPAGPRAHIDKGSCWFDVEAAADETPASDLLPCTPGGSGTMGGPPGSVPEEADTGVGGAGGGDGGGGGAAFPRVERCSTLRGSPLLPEEPLERSSREYGSPLFRGYARLSSRKELDLADGEPPQPCLSKSDSNQLSEQPPGKTTTAAVGGGAAAVEVEAEKCTPTRFSRAQKPCIEVPGSSDDLGDTPSPVPPPRKAALSHLVHLMVPGSVVGLVTHEFFDYSVAILVLGNAVLIGVQTEYAAAHVGDPEPAGFRAAEVCFCVVFAIEMALRLFVNRWSFLFQEVDGSILHGGEGDETAVALGKWSPSRWSLVSGWQWNLFDLVVVTLQLISVALDLALYGGLEGAGQAALGTNFLAMRMLRILRVIRIIRAARIVHFVRELRTMIASVAGTLRSLCWTVVLIALMLYIVGVHITQLVVEFARDDQDIMAPDKPLQTYYGSLWRSLLSLYEAMTGGIDWDNLVAPLVAEISPLAALGFALYIAFAVLAMMNVITGLFVDSALRNTKMEEDVDLVNQSRLLFKSIDFAATGQITWDQFQEQLDNPNMEQYFKAVDLDMSEARGLFKLLDLDESGSISVDEFVMGCLRLRGNAKAIDLATLMFENRKIHQRIRMMVERFDASLGELCDVQG